MVRQRIQLPDVTRIEREQRSGSGMLIGGAVGGVVLGAAFFALAASVCDNCSSSNYVGAIAGGVGLGGTLGAIIGGSAMPGKRTWIVLWSARR